MSAWAYLQCTGQHLRHAIVCVISLIELSDVPQCRDSKQPRREFVDIGRKSTSKYENGKRIAKPPRLSAPGTRFDGAQVGVCVCVLSK